MAEFNTTPKSHDAESFSTEERIAFLTSWGAAQVNGDATQDFMAKNINIANRVTSDILLAESSSHAPIFIVSSDDGQEYRVRMWRSDNNGYLDIFNSAGVQKIRLDGSDGSVRANILKLITTLASDGDTDNLITDEDNTVQVNVKRFNNYGRGFDFLLRDATNVFHKTLGIDYNSVNMYGAVNVNGILVHSSDRRKKENIIPFTPTNKTIEAVQFDYKKEWSGIKNNIGYIAQDVQEVEEFKKYVNIDKEGYLSLDYTGIHTAKIACLENEIKELKELVNKLL